MVDKEELAVRKGVEARTHTLGAERKKPNNAPQRAPPRCPVLEGSANSRGGWREQDPPLRRGPPEDAPQNEVFQV